MNAGEIISLFRTEVSDTEIPYLWSDDEVIPYLNDAYTMIIRFTGGVPDSTSAVTSIAVPIGSKTVSISDSIIRIMRVFRESDGEEVAVIEATDSPLVRDASGRLSLLRVGSSTGPVQFMVLGADRNKAALHPVPAATDTLRLQVRRIPAVKITTKADELVDLGDEHHIHLLHWMKAKAYRKHDSETLDLAKAALNESLFLSYCEQTAFEAERFRRKSLVSLRTERDLKNPMLMNSPNSGSRGRAAPTKG